MIRRLFTIRFHRRFLNESSKNNRQHQRRRRRRNEIERRTRKRNKNRKKNRSNSRSNRRMSTNRITSANGTIAEGNTTLSLFPRRTKTDVLSLRSFPTARSVFHHTCSNHVKYLTEYVCLWNGCERIRRQKWALISHIQVRAQDKSLSNRFCRFFLRKNIVRKLLFDKPNSNQRLTVQ